METCKRHGKNVVIVYQDGSCPLCDAERQINEWEKQDSEQRMAKHAAQPKTEQNEICPDCGGRIVDAFVLRKVCQTDNCLYNYRQD
jgi:predicted DCC family thiol-disulfide oxidoreductase YuxK